MARSVEQRGYHVTSALIGTRHTFAAYNYTGSLALWTMLEYELVDANKVCQRIQKVQGRTCYQECGCHLLWL